ncbi:penicillin-binding protein 1B [Thiohalobacter sp. IOR34]|uniref:penicillin-binding protein 1B n=1 Tax=Thiohalobacter sp. IOR34 TaxID=3057176 RepID=UPI0025AFC82D|nr:penicillin-binding protein 1B [Thiohalobacter sp. IOR34]WJW76536.1 penicillin-binding protein 1B [Thiohalobacter sp. IOR34]
MAARRKARRKNASTRSPKKRRKAGRRGGRSGFPWLRLLLTLLVALAAYGVYLDARVRSQFEGKRWALPAKVYARPLELYAGLELSARDFAAELEQLGYRPVRSPRRPGEVARDGGRFDLYTRAFAFPDGAEPGRRIRLRFEAGRLAELRAADTSRSLDLLRLEPLQIASIYPAHREDRILVRLDEVPPLLIETLIVVEDRAFYRHHGISPRAIARAMLANLRAGGLVQGGSTLTQQLVKNFYLSQARTLSRKLNEALMALLLELHYSKDEILEAYLNEVYLGQDGARAIHGFGLASRFYFDRPLKDLAPEQIALLVGLVKGPSYYDPRRHPQRARSRRNLVLELMASQGLIESSRLASYRARPLGTVRLRRLASNAYPAFLELVRSQLYRDYREEDLRSEGLRIFTSLDPRIQRAAEAGLATRLGRLERLRGMESGVLQGAVLVTGTEDGEVLAVVGDRQPQQAGFNRALAARRPVGSLLKPAVYLTALAEPRRYTLATLLDDSPLEVQQPDGSVWAPQNYDHRFRGPVLLHDALVHSYNVPTARLGLALGVPQVIGILHRLGLEREFSPWPSLLLGAAELTPLEITRLYQTFAAGGFRTPLRAIRAVLSATGEALQRYPLQVEQVFSPAQSFLINSALQDVVREGTAAPLARRFGAEAGIAGKTGTTDDLRDSWFAGFDGRRLMVAWVGRDDNQPMGLTGSAGALQVWSEVAGRIGIVPRRMPQPEDIEWAWIDRASGLRADSGCEDRIELPFIAGTVPTGLAPCAGRGPAGWLKRIFTP